jgi:hypothetical protein
LAARLCNLSGQYGPGAPPNKLLLILSGYLIRKIPMKNFIGISAIAGKTRQSTDKINFLFDFHFKANV